MAAAQSVWVRFTADFDFMPPEAPNSCIAFAAGFVGRVPLACWDQAEAKGVAKRVKAPRNRAEARTTRPDLKDRG